jgi:uncharacterized protein (DUF1330 family)
MRWSIPALSLVFIGGVAVGIAANPTQPLRAADSPVIYTVYEANVTDPIGYKNIFLKEVAPKLEQHGIKYLTRGLPARSFMGDAPKNRLVITKAKDMDTVMAFWNESKDDFKNIATKYADGIRWYAVEGVEQQ